MVVYQAMCLFAVVLSSHMPDLHLSSAHLFPSAPSSKKPLATFQGQIYQMRRDGRLKRQCLRGYLGMMISKLLSSISFWVGPDLLSETSLCEYLHLQLSSLLLRREDTFLKELKYQLIPLLEILCIFTLLWKSFIIKPGDNASPAGGSLGRLFPRNE